MHLILLFLLSFLPYYDGILPPSCFASLFFPHFPSFCLTTAIHCLGYSAWIRQVRIYTHRKDKGTFLWHNHYFRGVYESQRTIFRLQTRLEN